MTFPNLRPKSKNPNKVFSFRLDKNSPDPKERQARQRLDDLIEMGYSLREMVTEWLTDGQYIIEAAPVQDQIEAALDQFEHQFEARLSALLAKIPAQDLIAYGNQRDSDPEQSRGLTESFVNAVLEDFDI